MITDAQKARFAGRIKASIIVDDAGCWLWQKTRSHNGYGTFALGGGHNARAHRISFETFTGPIPLGLLVCNKCDVRACVNPDHLFTGTRSDNVSDAYRKGRMDLDRKSRGADHYLAKLTDAKVIAILDRLRAGEPKRRLASEYGVTPRMIRLISRGEAWKHIKRAAA